MRRRIYIIFSIWLLLFAVVYLVLGESWNAFVASGLSLAFEGLSETLKGSEGK